MSDKESPDGWCEHGLHTDTDNYVQKHVGSNRAAIMRALLKGAGESLGADWAGWDGGSEEARPDACWVRDMVMVLSDCAPRCSPDGRRPRGQSTRSRIGAEPKSGGNC